MPELHNTNFCRACGAHRRFRIAGDRFRCETCKAPLFDLSPVAGQPASPANEGGGLAAGDSSSDSGAAARLRDHDAQPSAAELPLATGPSGRISRFEFGHDMDAWRAERRRSLGASDVATVLGCNPFEDPYELWAEKSGAVPPAERHQNEKMRWGTLLEPVIAAEYGMRHGIVPRANGLALYRNERFPHLHATPDFWLGHEGLLECKNVGYSQKAAWKDAAPIYYQVQVQAQLAVLELGWAVLVALVGGQQLIEHRIERNDRFVASMLAATARFWNHVITKTEPLEAA